ncbi:TPA: hypothetical protein IFB41_001148 [Escherichia coli]|nr:hypothetical protein [Escherichia coli]
MKPTYEELEQRLIESERYGRQTDITIDNLEMKLAQMAAELASVKQQEPKAWFIRITDEVTVDAREGEKWRGVPLVRIDAETPATDEFLAEVRAQGVEMAVDVVKQCYDNICAGGLQENREYEEYIVQPHLDGIDDELNEIIAQLRKGVQS